LTVARDDARRDMLAANAAAFAVASGVCEDVRADDDDRVAVALRLAQVAEDAAERWQSAETRLSSSRTTYERHRRPAAEPGGGVHDADAQLRWLIRRRSLLERFGLTLRPDRTCTLHLVLCDPATSDLRDTDAA
jgi:hypothetical protein